MAAVKMIPIPELVEQKLAAFAEIQADFVESFGFIQAVHGQKRLESISISDIVHYIHALWICECKDRLLSIYRNIQRYDGTRALEALECWQQGSQTEVIALLLKKLDMHDFAEITIQLQAARQEQNAELAERLSQGRIIMINRSKNLMLALEAICEQTEENIEAELQQASQQYGHRAEQIAKQRIAIETPLYSYRPHQALARENMLIMNRLHIEIVTQVPLAQEPVETLANEPPLASPFSEQIIKGYVPFSSQV